MPDNAILSPELLGFRRQLKRNIRSSYRGMGSP